MSLSFQDDELGEVNDFKLKKKEIINPEIKKDSKTGPVFLSTEERKKILLEEVKKIEMKEKEREKVCKENKQLYIHSRNKHSDGRRERNRHRSRSKSWSRSRSRSRSRSHEFKAPKNRSEKDKDKEKKLDLSEKEKDAIKNYYLGLNKEKRKLVKPSEKFRNIFNFEWDASEDTSSDINPIYSKKIEPQILFGKGIRAGIDLKDQKKLSSKYENIFKEKERELQKSSTKKPSKLEKSDKQEKPEKSHKLEKQPEKPKYEDEFNIQWKDKTLLEMTERDWRIFREDFDIIIKGGRVPYPIRSWEESNLPEYILESIKVAGYKKPSSIQMQGISIGLERRDMIGLAPTGSGKSAAFLIPLVVYLSSLPLITPETAQNGPYAMIMAPSRELAQQIFEEFNKFAKFTKLRAASIVGGKSAEEQALILGVGVEVIIGTPGRIQDCLEKHFTILNQCNYIILDEADKMIKDGFEENLNFILDCIPASNMKSEDEKLVEEQEKECKLGIKTYRITMMFSATMTHQLEKLARKYLRCPSYISIGEPGSGKKEIEQRVELVTENQKKDRLIGMLEKFKPPIMIFLNHKRSVDNLCKLLERIDVKAATLHGGKTQEARERALSGFKEGKYDVLVCTNLVARGIDVSGVTLVVNYDAPTSIEDYNHRIGRTGRAEKKGIAVTFLTNNDESIFYELREYLELNNQHVPYELSQHPSSKIKPGTHSDHMPRRKQILYTN